MKNEAKPYNMMTADERVAARIAANRKIDENVKVRIAQESNERARQRRLNKEAGRLMNAMLTEAARETGLLDAIRKGTLSLGGSRREVGVDSPMFFRKVTGIL